MKLSEYLAAQTDDKYAQAMYTVVGNLQADMRHFEINKLIPGVRTDVEFFADAAVAYDFFLNITETNSANANATFDFLADITNGKMTFGANAGGTVDRMNTQTFLIKETFRELIYDVERTYCNPTFAEVTPGFFNSRPNVIYPLAGRVNVDRLLIDFLELSIFAGLTNRGDVPPTLTNALTFTTTVTGSVSPGVVSLPNVVTAGASVTAKRVDVHKVVIAFSVPVQVPFVPRDTVFVPLADGGKRVSGAEATKALAVEAIDSFIGRTEINRPVVINGSLVR